MMLSLRLPFGKSGYVCLVLYGLNLVAFRRFLRMYRHFAFHSALPTAGIPAGTHNLSVIVVTNDGKDVGVAAGAR